MDTKSRANEAEAFVRLALPLMMQVNVPVTPMNYSVWYAHVSGQNRELSQAIERMRREGESFTDEVNESLYQRYCAPQDTGALKELREDIRQVLVTVIQGLRELGGRSGQYGDLVNRQVRKLSENRPLQEIREIVKNLVTETRKMAVLGKRLQASLKTATQDLERLQQALEEAKSESLVDFLTGVANRKAFDAGLKEFMKEAASEEEPLCLLLVDIDHFKVFNDTFGHLVGDQVLRFVADKINSIIRGRDFLARIGGEEFAVVLPNTTLVGAGEVAKNICNLISLKGLKVADSQQSIGRVTVSIGLTAHRPGERPERLVERSDKALYHAKRSGRNCFSSEDDLAGGAHFLARHT